MRFFSILALALSAVMAQDHSTPPLKTFAEIATDAGLTSLLSAVNTANLTNTVVGLKDVTLFAPTNQAFDAIKDITAKLTPDQLKDVLLIHLTNGVFESTSLKTSEVPSLNPKQTLKIVVENGTVTVSGSKVTTADVKSSQGIVHIIDKVILPSLPSNNVTIGGVKSIIDTAKDANLTALLAAVAKANLTETLAGLKNVTLFAPTNAAFEAIKNATDKLTAEELKNILLIHIAPSVYLSKNLSNTQVKSLNGNETLSIKVSSVVTVSGSKVVKADVETSQGVVHVIDKVILPGAGSADVRSSAVKGVVSMLLVAMASMALLF